MVSLAHVRHRPLVQTGPSCRTLYSYLKPESVRVHPEATVRPWAVCEVLGDALSFASALGYVYARSASPSDSGTQDPC